MHPGRGFVPQGQKRANGPVSSTGSESASPCFFAAREQLVVQVSENDSFSGQLFVLKLLIYVLLG